MGRPNVYTDAERKERHRVASSMYYYKHKEKCKASVYRWREKNPEKSKAIDRAFFKRNPFKMYLKGVKYRTKNKEKRRQIEQSWRERNRTKASAIYQRYRSKKISAPGYDYTKAEHIEARWKVFDNKCWICTKPANHTDHVKPLDAGGTNYPANLRPICISCNSRKKNRWPIPGFVFERVETPSTLAIQHCNILGGYLRCRPAATC